MAPVQLWTKDGYGLRTFVQDPPKTDEVEVVSRFLAGIIENSDDPMLQAVSSIVCCRICFRCLHGHGTTNELFGKL